MGGPKKVARLQQLLKQNKAPAAIRLAKQLIAKQPRDPEIHYALGRAYLQDGKPELALMEFKTVNSIGIFDHIPEVDFRRTSAELYRRFNQPDEALKELLLLVQKDQSNADAYFQIGELFDSRGKATKAVSYYRKTLELQKGYGMAYLRLGIILYKAKKGDARKYLEKATRMEPERYESYYYLGRILKESKDYAGALQNFEWSAKDPEFRVKSLIERGTCFMEMNQVDRAVPELERAAKHAEAESDRLWSRHFLAACYERMREIDRAIDQWEAIYRIKPGFGNVAEKLAQYQDLRNDDMIKDFLTSSQEEFRQICAKATAGMGLSAQDISDIDDGVQVVAVEGKSNWRTQRKLPRLLRFLRTAELVDESKVRELHEEMRAQNLTRAVLVASSTFSRTATEYAESRPIELVNKDGLIQALKTQPEP